MERRTQQAVVDHGSWCVAVAKAGALKRPISASDTGSGRPDYGADRLSISHPRKSLPLELASTGAVAFVLKSALKPCGLRNNFQPYLLLPRVRARSAQRYSGRFSSICAGDTALGSR